MKRVGIVNADGTTSFETVDISAEETARAAEKAQEVADALALKALLTPRPGRVSLVSIREDLDLVMERVSALEGLVDV